LAKAVQPVRLPNISPKKSLANKFARRFVMGGIVLIGMTRRHLHGQGADIREAFCLATKCHEKGD
jgi:hypothetical protein